MSSHHESEARGPDGRMVDRMVFFSDAVFAIVLTVMVLELHAPVMEGAGMMANSRLPEALWTALLGEFHTFFAYIISFMLVCLWWSVHMRVTRHLHRFDWPSAVLNLLFILMVTLVPFAASVLGHNINNAAAWTIYWGVNCGASAAMTLLLFVMTRGGGRLVGGMGGRERAGRLLQAIAPGIAFGIGTWLAATDQLYLSRFCWVIMLPLMMVARILHGKPKTAAATAA